MSHRDSFVGAERLRVENVLGILTAIADRLETKHEVTTRLIGDAFEFVRAYEQGRLDDTGAGAGEPHLRLSVDHHLAARIPVRGMHQAVVALDRGDTSARDRFARYAREYVQLTRDHFRRSDRLFSRRHARTISRQGEVGGKAESTSTKGLYDRLLESAATLTAQELGSRRA
jgi:hemerythrin-like domain-containing protein